MQARCVCFHRQSRSVVTERWRAVDFVSRVQLRKSLARSSKVGALGTESIMWAGSSKVEYARAQLLHVVLVETLALR